jgi:hypothetical protein
MLDLKAIVEYWADLRNPCAELGRLYSRHPKVDFSRDVLQTHPERLQFLTVIPCGWNDVGTPERLAIMRWSLRPPEGASAPTGAFRLASAFDRLSSIQPTVISTDYRRAQGVASESGAHAARHEK